MVEYLSYGVGHIGVHFCLLGFEDAGDFTVTERLKTSIHANLKFYAILGSIGLFGIVLLSLMHKDGSDDIRGLAMACSNTFGLITGAFLLGFGLSEIPKSIWRNADWTTRQKIISHKISSTAAKLDHAEQELSKEIMVAQMTSNQMPKHDPLRPCLDVINNMLVEMFREDPSLKPQWSLLEKNDMDYGADEKSMSKLRRNLRNARGEYYRHKSEYVKYVMEAFELEDTIKNREHCGSTGWKFVSSLRPARSGKIGSFFDSMELIWRCFLKMQLQRLFAFVLGCMSAAILLAEATLLLSELDLSMFSILIKSVRKQEALVQLAAFVPLMYMCICTYYSLFRVGMLMFYSLTPRQTSSVNLLMICSMVARYAPSISYNFLNLLNLDGKITVFEKRMGTIGDAIPFFGKNFNKIYPLIMVVYTLLVSCNTFTRISNYSGNLKKFRFQMEEDDTDGFDPSGLLILQKERMWLEQGHAICEDAVRFPSSRGFSNMDIEESSFSNLAQKINVAELNASNRGVRSIESSSSRYNSKREEISRKYAAKRELVRKDGLEDSAKVPLLDSGNSAGPRKFIPLNCTKLFSSISLFESLDGAEISKFDLPRDNNAFD
ncbi:LMBR1 domain-containing protein 2 homolog A-like isoform X2 [Impatiens glandulifera]|uniref:LMBR1 domain-containing protein 2 homolog A-like isoform X2 n=1 Tax=Impatiens glandulifera TaxID=253017 RepID=UPI001FB09AB7|nr:LMBR1 domain-containing protein 2 homolog A-like isoform X2 [Impatiens glandulifera]